MLTIMARTVQQRGRQNQGAIGVFQVHEIFTGISQQL